MKHLDSSIGDDGKSDAIPRSGDIQEALTSFNKIVQELRPTPIQWYAVALATIALVLATVFAQAGGHS